MEDRKDISFEGEPIENEELQALLKSHWMISNISSKMNKEGVVSYNITLFRSFRHGRPRVSSLLERL